MSDPEAENTVVPDGIPPVIQAGIVAPQGAPDEELMARYAEGDAEAFEELYRRYRGPLYRFILRSVNGDREAAMDLFHEVMMKVIGAAQRWTPSAKFNTWIFRIARNTCIDASRRRKFLPKKRYADQHLSEVEDSNVEDIVVNAGSNPENAATDSETRSAIMELLNEMKPEQREVFLLREVEGLSFQEVAEIARCTISTAKSRMRYAIRFLALGLKQRGIETYNV